MWRSVFDVFVLSWEHCALFTRQFHGWAWNRIGRTCTLLPSSFSREKHRELSAKHMCWAPGLISIRRYHFELCVCVCECVCARVNGQWSISVFVDFLVAIVLSSWLMIECRQLSSSSFWPQSGCGLLFREGG